MFTIDLKQFKLLKACGRPEEDKACEQLTKIDSMIFYISYLIFDFWYLIFDIWYLIFNIWYLVLDIWYFCTIDLKRFKLLKSCGRPKEDKACEQLTEMDSQTELNCA